MPLGISADMNLRQELKANPRLYQQMNLLYMPLLDLRAHLNEELKDNPCLEPVEEEDTQVSLEEIRALAFGDGGGRAAAGFEVDADSKGRERAGPNQAQEDLWCHLSDQLRLLKLEERRIQVGEEIIGNIDADGYLTCSLDQVVESLNEHLSFGSTVREEDEESVDFSPVLVNEVKEMLEIIQGFEPSGVGARDLRETLLLQLGSKGQEDTFTFKLVRDRFNDVAEHRWKELSKEYGVTPQEVQAAHDEVKKLEPKPGLKYSSSSSPYVIPDLMVEKKEAGEGGGYRVSHNDGVLPRLQIGSSYREVLAQPGESEAKVKKFIAEKFEKAKLVIRDFDERRRTMIKLMEFIVDRQEVFFEKGEEHLRPLTQREVAEHVGMHESTVSRFSNKKYVRTPHGRVLPLKFFFSGGLSTDYGDDVSNRGVRLQIEKIVSREDSKAPFSDPQIVDLLRKDGIQIARRTVAKYRDELGILSARLRKRV